MGRRAQGWRLRPPRGKRTKYSVVFTLNGQEIERSTGTRDRGKAGREASRIYAAEVQRAPADRGDQRGRRTSGEGLRKAGREWLASLKGSVAESTQVTWGVYLEAHFCEHFQTLENVISPVAADYVSARLGKVRAQTVRKELSALRSLCAWLTRTKRISWTVDVPSPPRRAQGTVHSRRSRQPPPELAPAEVLAMIAILPEWSRKRQGKDGKAKRWPIRARFEFGYATGLRPWLLDKVSVPRHYQRGDAKLNITADIDKNRWARRVPLPKMARDALERVAPDKGLIFGKHDYREELAKAAAKVLDPLRAEQFNGSHLRSACGTHWLEKTKNIAGVQFALGHRRVSSTERYIKPSERAAEEMLAEVE